MQRATHDIRRPGQRVRQGVVTPTSVTRDGPETGQTVVAKFDKADASTLGAVTGKAVEKQLAVRLDGKVLSAPVVKEPLTGGKVAFAPGTASEAEKVATELGASATADSIGGRNTGLLPPGRS